MPWKRRIAGMSRRCSWIATADRGPVYERVPFYRKRLDEAGIKPQDIRSLKDLRRIPFTLKEDLRQNYPYGLFAAPMNEIVRIHASTGTTGKPTVVGVHPRGTWTTGAS